MLNISPTNLSPGCTGSGWPSRRAKRRRRLPRWLRLIVSGLVIIGVIVAVWKIGRFRKWNVRSSKAFVIPFMLWWLWINSRLADSNASWMSWLHEVPPTFEWSNSMIRMIGMRVVAIALTRRATVFSALCIRVPAFTSNAGVLDMIAPPTSLAGDALDLVVRKNWEVALTRLPVFAFH